jgi:hypothetical protein
LAEHPDARLVERAYCIPVLVEALKYARDVLTGTYEWKEGSVGLEKIDAAIREAEGTEARRS